MDLKAQCNRAHDLVLPSWDPVVTGIYIPLAPIRGWDTLFYGLRLGSVIMKTSANLEVPR